MGIRILCLLVLALLSAWPAASTGNKTGPDPRQLISDALTHWNGSTSRFVTNMRIHRPDWERRVTMRIVTRDTTSSLVRVTYPPKEAGNATLLVDGRMWTYTPRLNRVVRLPSSMMSQNWMGSDFSNNEIARSSQLLEHYELRLLRTESSDQHLVHVIAAIPFANAPVVWGKLELHLRDDHVLLEETFFDQAGAPVKRLQSLETGVFDNRVISTRQRMTSLEREDQWTEVELTEGHYDVVLDDATFTLSQLRNPSAGLEAGQ